MTDKFCVNCKHSTNATIMRCLKLKRKTLDEFTSPVTGEHIGAHYLIPDCHNMRQKNGECGPEGKFWEPKPQKVPLWRRLFLWIIRNAPD